MKWVKRISLVLLFLLLILLTMVGWIVTTQSGLHFALNTAVRWLPGLEIAIISGSWSDLNLQGVRYRTKGMNVDVDKFNLSLQVNCLKRFQLCVNNISAEGVDVEIDTKAFPNVEEPANSKPLTKLSTPYPILLKKVTLKNINIHLDNIQVSLAELTMAVDWHANLLTIKSTTINGLAVNLPKTIVEENKTTGKMVTKITNGVADKLPAETLKALFAEPLLANLPEIVLPIDINIEQIQGVNWHLGGDTKVAIDNLTLMATVEDQQIVIKQFVVVAPEGKITITGDANLAQQWPVNIVVQAVSYLNDLKGQEVDLKLEGALLQQLKLMLSLTGPIEANLVAETALSQAGLPIQLTLESQQINWPLQGEPEYRLKNLRLRLNGKVTGYDLSLRTDINGQNMPPSLLTFDAKGNEQQHSVKMNIAGKPISGHLILKGSFDRQKKLWRGVLDNTLFNLPIGEWQLSQAVAIEYDNQQQEVTLSPHCWLNAKGSFCLSKTAKIGKFGNADILLQQFDLALLKPLLPAETQLTGSFDGDVKVSWYADGRSPEAKVNLLGNGVKIKQLIEGSLLPVEFQTLTLNADMSNGKMVLQWLIQIINNGKFSGNIRIDDLQQSRKLSGSINIENISLALIRPILSKGERFDGNLNADLRLSGNMKQPLLNGNLALSNVAAKGHCFPFDINQGFIKLNFMGTHSQLTGRINTPEGYLKLIGEADWRNIKAWQAKVSATGDRLRIILPPMVRIDVEPDIVFEATPNLLRLNGNVNIPWARITVQELPESVVGVSPDEVMLNANLYPIKKKGISIPILTNLHIKIGNYVRLDAFGLKARLTGLLKVIQDKQGLGLNGQIDISEGRFHAYGQDLIVRKGQILFSGPVDQPFLNVEAIRNPESTNDNVIAGVRVTGLADKLKATIFSEPVKSQEEALSYLLRGKGLDSSGPDSTHIAALLISMGVSKTGKLLGGIGETFGVSDLALDTQGVGDKSQVVVSGKITNDLQVKYGVGILNSLATLTLRYRLMPKLYLEAVSGVDQALDLLYQFEF
ncbi:MAG: translocation/assembly module TamB domain-containing protein [Candidatus Phlomobacter fragariae]